MNPLVSPIFESALFEPGGIVLLFVKAMFVLGGLLYALFALLVIRQIQLMRSTIQTSLSDFLMTIGIIHLLLSVLVLLYFVIL